jgi:hypothetical protein
MDAYEKLREILDASPTGAPVSNAFDEILRILFTPQEAALAVHMTLFPRPVDAIASDAGIPLNETHGNSGRVESAGINRHRVGDERALHKRSSYPLWPRVMCGLS